MFFFVQKMMLLSFPDRKLRSWEGLGDIKEAIFALRGNRVAAVDVALCELVSVYNLPSIWVTVELQKFVYSVYTFLSLSLLSSNFFTLVKSTL